MLNGDLFFHSAPTTAARTEKKTLGQLLCERACSKLWFKNSVSRLALEWNVGGRGTGVPASLPQLLLCLPPLMSPLLFFHQVVWPLQDPRPQVREDGGQAGGEGADGQSGH